MSFEEIEMFEDLLERLEVLREDNNGTLSEYCLGVEDTINWIMGNQEQPNL